VDANVLEPSRNEEGRPEIVFFSCLDFKRKSIQVLSKTPELYALRGWSVTCLVVRDDSVHDSYKYEEEFNPPGVNVVRIGLPLTWLLDRLGQRRVFVRLIQKIAYWWAILKLIGLARHLDFRPDIIYGYEIHGVIAGKLYQLLHSSKQAKFVARFMGTRITETLEEKQFIRALVNFDALLAMRLAADCVIMTNDGTEALKTYKKIGSRRNSNLHFWTNGVGDDAPPNMKLPKDHLASRGGPFVTPRVNLVAISRLAPWKRVERSLELVAKLKIRAIVSPRLTIVGDGPDKERLVSHCKSLNIVEEVQFKGAMLHEDVWRELLGADFFLSFYDLSNVGNPLLESIFALIPPVTLNNGDTGSWVKHGVNGLIYEIGSDFVSESAVDIETYFINGDKYTALCDGLVNTKERKLWSWQDRLRREFEVVSDLIRV
jgi:glycosyltransferase involved in cell wall biosynthesis